MKKNYFLTFFFFICFSKDAHAYIDPGTGSLIVQAIIGFIAAFIAGITFYWNKLKSFVLKIIKKEKNVTISKDR